ncbi:MAG: sugar ABC transporter substrate-binding protein [Spirochaetales bacterium]|nr:sugar ABC transporter substrate-binding protein [Spirochaetales bacterium]
MNTKKIMFLLFLIIVLSSTIFSLGNQEGDENVIEVAFSFGAEWLEVYQAMEDMALKAADESGRNINFQFWYADGNLDKEASNIRKAIAAEPDIMVLMPISASSILHHIEGIHRKNIPVIVYNRQQESHLTIKPEAFIGLDTYNQALTTATGLFKLMSEDNIQAKTVVILGDLHDRNALNRREGFRKAAEEFDVEIIEEIESYWDSDKAVLGLSAVFDKYPEINSILLSSDFMITDIKKLLSSRNKWAPYGEKNHIYLGGQDIFSEAIPLIRDGYIDVDTAFDIWPMSTTLVQIINTLANKQKPAQNVFLIPGRIVTRRNIDSIKDLWSTEN